MTDLTKDEATLLRGLLARARRALAALGTDADNRDALCLEIDAALNQQPTQHAVPDASVCYVAVCDGRIDQVYDAASRERFLKVCDDIEADAARVPGAQVRFVRLLVRCYGHRPVMGSQLRGTGSPSLVSIDMQLAEVLETIPWSRFQ